MTEQQQIDAIRTALRAIPNEYFSAWPGGWPEELGTALVEAVYSIQATYNAKDPKRGVAGRLRTFRTDHPEARNDLGVLTTIGEERIREIMGDTKVSRGRKYKSVAVLEAAENLRSLSPAVNAAGDFRKADPNEVQRAYTSVNGLGWVTFDYLGMLLGRPGVKSDVMINRFVNEALAAEDLPGVSREQSKALLTAVQEQDAPAENLTFLDHAIWLHEQDRAADQNLDEELQAPA